MTISLLYQRISMGCRYSIPIATTVFLSVLTVLPLHIPALASVMPILSLLSVYHWSIYRSVLMPPFGVFLCGLFADIVGGFPMGAHALLFLVLWGVIEFQRRLFVNRSFLVLWVLFVLINAIGKITLWFVLSLYFQDVVPIAPALIQYGLEIALFPLFSWVFTLLQNRFIRIT